MIGRKIYYDNRTGNEVLTIPEKHHENATDTTKQQDFNMYDVLAARNPDNVGVLRLEYGEKRGDFEKARSIHVNTETGEIEFEFPSFEKPHSMRLRELENYKQLSKEEQSVLGQGLTDAELENMKQGQNQTDFELRLLTLEAK